MASPNSLVGAVLCGRYRLTKLIGQGGMGSVYEAHDRQMADRQVAVKVLAAHLTTDETQVTRFEQEARAANQLRHPNTISVLDFGHTEDGLLFMALEYLHGETLTQVMRHGPLDPARGLYMLRQVCKSLAEAHAKGIIHRDLKPDNIFVCEIYGESDFIKVIDFGIAKLAVGGAELTQAGKMFGTPRYLSPEQAQGLPLTATSDLYSLGVILFEMLTGQVPFHADDSLSIAIKHVQEPAPALRDVAPELRVPPELEQMVARMLAKRPASRFQSAEQVLAALDASLDALGAGVRATSPLPLTGPRTPTKPKTIPPIPAPRTVPKLAEHEATHTVTVAEEATQLVAPLPDDPDEATRAVAAMDAPAPADALSARTPSTPKAAVPTPADSRTGGEGQTLALDVETTTGGGVQARRPERPTPKRRTAPPPRRQVAAPLLEKHDGPNKLILLGVAVVLAAVGGGGAWWWRGGHPAVAVSAQGEPTTLAPAATRAPSIAPAVIAAPEPPPAPMPPTAAEPAPHRVEIVSDPPGASVTIDGMPAGTTPVELKLSGSANPIVAILALAGHEDYRLEIDPQKVREAGIARLPIHLVAKPMTKPPTSKPAPHKAKVDWQ